MLRRGRGEIGDEHREDQPGVQAAEQNQTEIRCEYCGSVYALSAVELRALAADIRRERS